MAFEQIRLNRALSRLELGLAVILISVFATWAMKRMSVLEAVAESEGLDLTIRNLRLGTMVYVSTQLLKGRLDRIASLADETPVGTVINAPPGYIGTLQGADPDNVQPGQWYYDVDKHMLVYHIVNGDYFRSDDGGPKRVRIKLDLDYRDNNRNGVYDRGIDRPLGIRVMVLDKLDWQFQGGA